MKYLFLLFCALPIGIHAHSKGLEPIENSERDSRVSQRLVGEQTLQPTKRPELIRRGGSGDYISKTALFELSSDDFSQPYRFPLLADNRGDLSNHIILGKVIYSEVRGKAANKMLLELDSKYVDENQPYPNQRLENDLYLVIYGRGISCIYYKINVGKGGPYRCAFYWDPNTKDTFSAALPLPRPAGGGTN